MIITTRKLTLLLGIVALIGMFFVTSKHSASAAELPIQQVTTQRRGDLSFLSQRIGKIHMVHTLPLKGSDKQTEQKKEIYASLPIHSKDLDEIHAAVVQPTKRGDLKVLSDKVAEIYYATALPTKNFDQ